MGDKIYPPELRSGGVEGIRDAVADVHVDGRKVDTDDGIIARVPYVDFLHSVSTSAYREGNYAPEVGYARHSNCIHNGDTSGPLLLSHRRQPFPNNMLYQELKVVGCSYARI